MIPVIGATTVNIGQIKVPENTTGFISAKIVAFDADLPDNTLKKEARIGFRRVAGVISADPVWVVYDGTSEALQGCALGTSTAVNVLHLDFTGLSNKTIYVTCILEAIRMV